MVVAVIVVLCKDQSFTVATEAASDASVKQDRLDLNFHVVDRVRGLNLKNGLAGGVLVKDLQAAVVCYEVIGFTVATEATSDASVKQDHLFFKVHVVNRVIGPFEVLVWGVKYGHGD